MGKQSQPNSKLHEHDKDVQGEMFLTGRHQEIPRNPHEEFAKTTLAAGAVLWRGDPVSYTHLTLPTTPYV